MRKILTSSVLLAVLMTGCAKPKSAGNGAASPGRNPSNNGEVLLQLKHDPTADAAPGQQTFQINWTDRPDLKNEALVGAMGTDPQTGEPRFYSAEELRRMAK
jgi:hypothetical protein